jgi:hypothetical protein
VTELPDGEKKEYCYFFTRKNHYDIMDTFFMPLICRAFNDYNQINEYNSRILVNRLHDLIQSHFMNPSE